MQLVILFINDTGSRPNIYNNIASNLGLYTLFHYLYGIIFDCVTAASVDFLPLPLYNGCNVVPIGVKRSRFFVSADDMPGCAQGRNA